MVFMAYQDHWLDGGKQRKEDRSKKTTKSLFSYPGERKGSKRLGSSTTRFRSIFIQQGFAEDVKVK